MENHHNTVMNNNGVDAVSDPKMETSNEAIAAEEKQNGNESAMRNITNSSMAGKCDMNGVDSIPSPNGASSLHQTASNESIDAGASSSKTTSNWFIDFVDDMRKMMRNRTFALQCIAQGKTLLTSTVPVTFFTPTVYVCDLLSSFRSFGSCRHCTVPSQSSGGGLHFCLQ